MINSFCSKHGGKFEDWDIGDGLCPRCEEIRINDLCRDCEIHKATEIFSEGSIAYVHGMYSRICKCCLLEKWRVTQKSLEEGISKLSSQLAVTPCQWLLIGMNQDLKIQ